MYWLGEADHALRTPYFYTGAKAKIQHPWNGHIFFLVMCLPWVATKIKEKFCFHPRSTNVLKHTRWKRNVVYLYFIVHSFVRFCRENVDKLRKADGLLSGIMVEHVNVTTSDLPDAFSPDSTCPNEEHGNGLFTLAYSGTGTSTIGNNGVQVPV